jgi:hypothetical protein
MAESIYSGEAGGRVTVREGIMAREGADKRPLDPRLDLRNHSPSGFAWGDDGSGQAQLALALLADALRNDERALRLYQDFNRRVVTLFPTRWTITGSRVLAYIDMIEIKNNKLPDAISSLLSDHDQTAVTSVRINPVVPRSRLPAGDAPDAESGKLPIEPASAQAPLGDHDPTHLDLGLPGTEDPTTESSSVSPPLAAEVPGDAEVAAEPASAQVPLGDHDPTHLDSSLTGTEEPTTESSILTVAPPFAAEVPVHAEAVDAPDAESCKPPIEPASAQAPLGDHDPTHLDSGLTGTEEPTTESSSLTVEPPLAAEAEVTAQVIMAPPETVVTAKLGPAWHCKVRHRGSAQAPLEDHDPTHLDSGLTGTEEPTTEPSILTVAPPLGDHDPTHLDSGPTGTEEPTTESSGPTVAPPFAAEVPGDAEVAAHVIMAPPETDPKIAVVVTAKLGPAWHCKVRHRGTQAPLEDHDPIHLDSGLTGTEEPTTEPSILTVAAPPLGDHDPTHLDSSLTGTEEPTTETSILTVAPPLGDHDPTHLDSGLTRTEEPTTESSSPTVAPPFAAEVPGDAEVAAHVIMAPPETDPKIAVVVKAKPQAKAEPAAPRPIDAISLLIQAMAEIDELRR